MPDITSYSNGRPSWADLMCHDGDAAKHFYSSLFGWEIVDNPIDENLVPFQSDLVG